MSSEPKHLTRARDAVRELRTDHARLTELRDAAHAALKAARRADESALRRASLEAAGLTQALDQVTAELRDAEQHLADLEADHRRATLEAEHEALTAKLDQLARAYTNGVNSAVDQALAALATVNQADADARHTHALLVTVARDLGRPEPRAYRPAGVTGVLAAREHAVREDERLTFAMIEASATHPVTRGATRADLARNAAERDARGRAATYRAQHAAHVELANAGDPARAAAAQAWLARNPAPEAAA